MTLPEDTSLTIQAGSDPDQANLDYNAGQYSLQSLEISLAPLGGTEPVFYPVELGLATFDLTGVEQQIALEDVHGNPIIAPSTGLLLFTFNIPGLDLYQVTELKKSDRLRLQRASSEEPSGLYTDASTHQVYFEADAHSGGATVGNTILVEHVKTTQASSSRPQVRPSVTQFDLTSGDTMPAAGNIGNNVYGYELAIAQAGHVFAARIVGYAGIRGNSRPSSVSVLKNLASDEFSHDSGTITIPAGTTLAAEEVYTVELQVFEEGQNVSTDEPASYHDDRITARAAAAAVWHFGIIPSAQAAGDVVFADDDIITMAMAAGDYTISTGDFADATTTYVFYLAGPSGTTQPTGWLMGGQSIAAGVGAAVQRTISGVDYNFYLLNSAFAFRQEDAATVTVT